jgi:hypothetical protein
VDELREEILQAERTRSDLLKWKLGLVGTIGALGLGFSGSNSIHNAQLVLVVIPLVCVYVDLLCLHLTLRIVVIGTFMYQWTPSGETKDPLKAYERFARGARRLPDPSERKMSAYALEDWALYLSTLILSASAFVYGVVLLWPHHPGGYAALFLSSGAIGLAATLIGRRLYRKRMDAVSAMQLAPSA